MVSRRTALLGIVLPTLMALGLRVWSSFNELTLDEIWSLALVESCPSPGAVFQVKLDNNHLLNSLYLYFCGAQFNWNVYRVPHILLGSASVALGAAIGRRQNPATGFVSAVLLCFSFLLIDLSSQARGYGLVMFFVLGAYYCLERALEERAWQWPVLYSIGCILGFLSHLLFATFFSAAVVWSAHRFYTTRDSWRGFCSNMLRCHALPGVFFIALYIRFVRGMVIGGGDPYVASQTLGQTFAYTLGFPAEGAWVYAALIAGFALMLAGLTLLWVRKDFGGLLFFSTAIIIAPAALIVFRRPEVLAPRYFLPSMIFFLLLLARLLAAGIQAGAALRVFAIAAMTLFVLGNGLHLHALIETGRGRLVETLHYILAHSHSASTTIGSDHDFRTRAPVLFFKRYVAGGEGIHYVRKTDWPAGGPEWILLNRLMPDDLEKGLTDAAGNRYVYAANFSIAVFKNSGNRLEIK